MSPFEVPIAIEEPAARQMDLPRVLFPLSEKACSVMFLNFVHFTTSQGDFLPKSSAGEKASREEVEDFLEWLSLNVADRLRP